MFEISPLLAYETGVHLGDGNLTCKKEWNLSRITYAGNSATDSEYFESILSGILRAIYGNLRRLKIKSQQRKLRRRGKFDEYRISICGRKQLSLWMQKVGFYNPKHLKKINDFYSGSVVEF